MIVAIATAMSAASALWLIGNYGRERQFLLAHQRDARTVPLAKSSPSRSPGGRAGK
jgi:hypothetical protein